jgi:hypothetical protein
MKRVSQAPAAVGGPTCVSLRPQYQTAEAFLRYKETELNTDELSTYVGGLLASDLQNRGTPEEQAGAQQRVTENLGKLRVLEQRVASFQKCVQQDIIQKQQYSGELYSLQQDISAKEKDVKEMEEIAKEAQERSELLDAPYTKTTRLQGLFPLGRPLQERSLPVLLSFALLFLVLSLGMFLRLASINLELHWFSSSGSSVLSGYGIGR